MSSKKLDLMKRPDRITWAPGWTRPMRMVSIISQLRYTSRTRARLLIHMFGESKV